MVLSWERSEEKEFVEMMYANENGGRFDSGHRGDTVGLFFIITPRLVFPCFPLLPLFFQGFVFEITFRWEFLD